MNINFNYFKSTVHSDHQREYIFPSLRIAHIIEGEFDWEIGSNTYTLSAGDIVLLNNLLPRTIKNQSKPLAHIDIFEFLPIELMERPLLAQAFYGQKTNIIFHQTGTLYAIYSLPYQLHMKPLKTKPSANILCKRSLI